MAARPPSRVIGWLDTEDGLRWPVVCTPVFGYILAIGRNTDGAYGAIEVRTDDSRVTLTEKAYAHFRYEANSYDSIQGGWMNTVYQEITNRDTVLRWTSSLSATGIYNYITAQIASGSTVSMGSSRASAS